MKTCLENPWQKGCEKLMEKQNFFIGKIGIYCTLSKECYATL